MGKWYDSILIKIYTCLTHTQTSVCVSPSVIYANVRNKKQLEGIRGTFWTFTTLKTPLQENWLMQPLYLHISHYWEKGYTEVVPGEQEWRLLGLLVCIFLRKGNKHCWLLPWESRNDMLARPAQVSGEMECWGQHVSLPVQACLCGVLPRGSPALGLCLISSPSLVSAWPTELTHSWERTCWLRGPLDHFFFQCKSYQLAF